MQRITSAQNPLIKHFCKLRLNRDYREEQQRVFIEGVKLVSEVGSHVHVYTVIVADGTLLPSGIQAEQVFTVPESLFYKISGMHSPEGIAAEVAMPAYASLTDLKYLVAFDGISDPGNLGALLRSALAFGWEGAILFNDTCDPFNEKAIRAAKGATFRLPLACGSQEELHSLIHANQLTPYFADIQGQRMDQVAEKKNVLLVLGNEAHGVSEAIRQSCRAVTIPMSGEMESLNVSVAGGILLYELRKRSVNE